MNAKDSRKRPYQSKRRQEQARKTQRLILTAAQKLFSEYGYAGATIEAIAQEASVSPMTIYATFGNKRSLLASLIDISVGGDEEPIPLLQRPGPQGVLKEKDPAEQIRRFAVDITDILERVTPIFEIMRTAEKSEPEIAEMLETILEQRLHNIGTFVKHVSANGKLHDDLDDVRATEIVWAVASPEMYRLLIGDRRWSKEYFSNWLGDTLIRLLLE